VQFQVAGDGKVKAKAEVKARLARVKEWMKERLAASSCCRNPRAAWRETVPG
jgi:hypothetical protein